MKKHRNIWKRGLACIAAAVMSVGSINVPEAEAMAAGNSSVPEAVNMKLDSCQEYGGQLWEESSTTVGKADAEDVLSNDELFEEYLERLFYGDGETLPRADKHLTAEQMDKNEGTMYKALKPFITEIADGKRECTEVTLDDVTLAYYANPSDDVYGRDGAKIFLLNVVNKAIRKLLSDCPYELYWYSKTEGWKCPTMKYNRLGNLHKISDITLVFTVAVEYAQENEAGEKLLYMVDGTQVRRAQTARANAVAVVAKNSSLGDYEKLYAYLEEICRLTEYDSDAAALVGDKSIMYNDPWQLVSVFDGDKETNVVCEGYSKAFAYLCEMSRFESEKVHCYIVTGYLNGASGEAHMWNIVTMDDGRNYIVDITNCDSGNIGASDLLFLAGGSGSVDGGYMFTFPGGDRRTLSFLYDEAALELHPKSILALADGYYFRQAQALEQRTASTGDSTDNDVPFGQPEDQMNVAGRTQNGIAVRVNTTSYGTAAITTVANTKSAAVSISSTVTVNDIAYTVTVIGKYAFEKCTEAETIQLPSTIRGIQKNVFSGAKKLRVVKISSGKAVTVKKGAFQGLSTKKMTVKITEKMPKKEFGKMKKNLKGAGFKGRIRRV